jgi:hypothetical protein
MFAERTFYCLQTRGIVSYQNKVKENASLRRYYPGQVIRVDEIISQHVVNTIWYNSTPSICMERFPL